MRLLNVDSRDLEEFHGDAIPPYAILSHTWGKEEVTFHDLTKEGHRQKRGYAKIEGCLWVDTCCIEKSSSAELSEAINSMYRWYEVSRELLAPRRTIFFASDWKPVFHPDIDQNRNRQVGLLSGITSIPRRVLDGEISLSSVSAACKFSWAATRVTTRVEDMAYCLLGLLGVNMPLLYGEGDKAFVRLQEAVLSNSEDISILAWDTISRGRLLRMKHRHQSLRGRPLHFSDIPEVTIGTCGECHAPIPP
ncbi:hypothetical protein BKA66DRAFT_509501 [Pyrenochaeta sp. MPI-SDFR-AT-0127]|nr:hypothetical protein BKA66DRAFT_509501 [Pyrenochaeta sp. MPI-SDFR-AT-0127]